VPSRGFKLAALLACGCLFWAAAEARQQAEPDKDLKEEIRRSVDKGVAFLRKTQGRDGTWPQTSGGGGQENTVGATAMCGVAMLESGVDADDSAITKALSFVRGKTKELNYTYAIAAAIIFLDRGSKGTEGGTIKMLGQKLMEGQLNTGGWTYYCPNRGGIADNSNSQFALLGLWVARRNGLKADSTLQKAEKYFRDNQQNDGGWAYQFVMGPLGSTNPQMTCAGLMALAFGHGTRHKAETEFKQTGKDQDAEAPQKRQRVAPNLKADPQVMKAKEYLSLWMARPFHVDEHAIYCLWTLERVCMIYGYSQFNGIDWYSWGSKIIMSRQRNDGGWASDAISGRNCETAWALLFLRKSNLTADLDVGEAQFEKGNFNERRNRGAGTGVRPPPKQEKTKPGRDPVPGEAKALGEELRTALDDERVAQILDVLENTKGPEYTQYLADAIPQVRLTVKEQVRKALQSRLSRMSRNTLMQYLNHENKELKLAALALLPTKDEAREAIPEIIPVLRDKDLQISIAAHEALKKISGKDHGRDATAWARWWDDGGK
jgi:hypothetical protein